MDQANQGCRVWYSSPTDQFPLPFQPGTFRTRGARDEVASRGHLRWDLHRGLDHVADFTCRSVSFDSPVTALLRRSEIAHFSVLASEPCACGHAHWSVSTCTTSSTGTLQLWQPTLYDSSCLTSWALETRDCIGWFCGDLCPSPFWTSHTCHTLFSAAVALASRNAVADTGIGGKGTRPPIFISGASCPLVRPDVKLPTNSKITPDLH